MSDTDNKMLIECPHCQQRFSAEMPICEIVNTENFSMMAAHHPVLTTCPNNLCRQTFRLAISELRTGWVAQPVKRESPLLLPRGLKVVGRG